MLYAFVILRLRKDNQKRRKFQILKKYVLQIWFVFKPLDNSRLSVVIKLLLLWIVTLFPWKINGNCASHMYFLSFWRSIIPFFSANFHFCSVWKWYVIYLFLTGLYIFLIQIYNKLSVCIMMFLSDYTRFIILFAKQQ